MTHSRTISIFLTAAIAIAALVAAYTVLVNVDSGQSSPDPRQDSGDLPIPSPTPTVPAATFTDRESALRELEATQPELASAIAAFEAEDRGAMLNSLRWEEFECTPDDYRGGVAPRCSELGIVAGTSVPMFHYQLLSTSYFTRDQMEERFDNYLIGLSPELGLVASHPDGRWLITFTVDEGGEEGLRGVDFFAEGEGAEPFVSHKDRYVASTPLDTLRDEDRERELQWTVLYASPRLLEWEAEKDAMHRQD